MRKKNKKFLIIITNFIFLFSCMSECANAYAFSFGIGTPVPDMSDTAAYDRMPDRPVPEFPFDGISDAALNDNAPLADENTPTSGICGDGALWSFDRQSGLLTVSGQGAIYDYDYDGGNYAPWYAFREEITDILISSGITSIGNNSFRGLAKATGVNIPTGTVRIGNDSFMACHSLTDVILPDGITSIGYNAFNDTPYLAGLENEEHLFITPQGYLLRSWSGAEKIIVPNEVKVIASWTFFWVPCLSAEINADCFICSEAFYACTKMQNVTVNGDCFTEDGAFVFSDELAEFKINGNLTSNGSTIKYGNKVKSIYIAGNLFADSKIIQWNDSIESIYIGGDCTLLDGLADTCGELQNVTIGGRLVMNGSFVTNCPKLKKISYNAERAKPAIKDNTTGKTNRAMIKISRAVSCLPHDANMNTYSDRTEYNNGFGYFIPRRCAQEIEAPDGTVYVACGVKDVMQIVSPYFANPILEIRKQGFDFAAACIDNEYNWYIMWSYKIPNEIAQEHLEDENIVIAKYTFNGQLVGECKMKVKETSAPLPLDFGSASMAVKDNILGVFYNTVWLNGHQGAEFAAINKESMELVYFSDHQGSHAFGTVLYPTKNGFTGAHLGDAFPRGITFHSYYVSGSDFKITSNGPVLMHSSGDDTDTHTHWGGFAVGNTTYAVAGKAERCYTSGNYEEFKSTNPKGADIFDVFVRIVDQTLLQTDDIGGENRIDAATGEIADTNVFWLTSCNSTVKAGQVKVVTLENGAYCVLWEKMVNDKFDSIRYVIMDECGKILRNETAIYGARLSNTSIQPIVHGNTLIWATADAEEGKVTWYTVNLEAFGDVNQNGETTLDDAIMTLQKAMKVNLSSAAFNELEADINSDGEITLNDAVEILKMAMKVTS